MSYHTYCLFEIFLRISHLSQVLREVQQCLSISLGVTNPPFAQDT